MSSSRPAWRWHELRDFTPKAETTMKRILVLALLAVAIVASSALAQTFPGPATPTQARIYFYRTADIGNQVMGWTRVFINDQKVGDLNASTYFYRDVPPGQLQDQRQQRCALSGPIPRI